MLNTEHQKKVLVTQFLPFLKRFLISQLIRIHILFHIQMGSSVDITPHGDPRGGGTLICSSYVGLGPASTVHHPKISGISSTQKISSYPQKIFIFLKTKKNSEIQNFESKNGPSLRMNENIRVPHSPLGRRRSLDEHSRVDNV